ncbi:MAG: hypothetical protein KF850_11760 [Labilithrix sp.]|nr:hypothetical protein [Labilithrix sp.]
MNFTRGGALTALGLLIVAGCGGSDASPLADGPDDRERVVVDLPDGGKVESPPPPTPTPVGGEPPPEGVFVSASKGAPGNDGSPLRPLSTLADGIALAKQKRAMVIACAETYPEHVTMGDGVTMFGYFDCSDLGKWKRVKTRSVIASPTSPAVLVEGMTLITRFEGFEALGPDLTAPGSPDVAAETSYGMIIRGSSNLWMDEVTLRGGRGQDGVDGVEPAPNRELSNAVNGVDAVLQGTPCNPQAHNCFTQTRTAGGLPGTSRCAVGPAGGAGGAGGMGPFLRADGSPRLQSPLNAESTGKPAPKNTPYAVGGAGGANIDASTNTTFTSVGGGGTPGATGTVGGNGSWTVNGNGVVPGNGTDGSNGDPGQGGGGGGGGRNWYSESYVPVTPPSGMAHGLAGAGGGAGGCGGSAGTAGTGGGGSVALFVVSSTSIKVANSRLEPGKGGRAGVGAIGTPGLAGGSGGRGRRVDVINDLRPAGAYGLAGGAGGRGGAAGMSGNGSAGPAIGLLYNGSRVAINQETTGIFAGEAGDGVPAATSGGKTRPATEGVAKQEHSF